MYLELDNSDYMWAYGITKTICECSYISNIRSSIIGEETKNKRSLLEWVRSNKNGQINGFENYYWNGVTCLEMAKIIDEIIVKDIFWEGIRHVYSPRKVSKYELVSLISKYYKLDIKIKKQFLEEKIDRTLSSIYDNYFLIPDIEEQLKDLSEWDDE